MKIEGIQAISATDGQNLPPPGFLGLINVHALLVTLEYLLESYIFFEVLYIMAQMWYYIKNFSSKQTKVTSDFISNYLKKVIGGATTQKNLKTNTKIFYIDLRYVS